MDELIKTIQKNKGLVAVGLAVLMFLFFAFGGATKLSASISSLGSAESPSFSFFKMLSDLEDIGFTKFIGILMLAAPILVILGNFVDLKLKGTLKEKFNLICFVAAAALCLVFWISLPGESGGGFSISMTLAWGSWLYLVLAIAGIVVAGYLDKLTAKK